MFAYVGRVYTVCSNNTANVAQDPLGVYFYALKSKFKESSVT